MNDILALQGKHDQNGEEESDQGDGTDFGDEFYFVPRSALCVKTDDAGDYPGDKRDPQIDKDAFCDLADGDVHHSPLQSQPLGNNRDEDIRINRKEDHLKDGVEGHQPSTVFPVPGGEIIPHDDHGDASGQTDHDEPYHVFIMSREEGDSQEKHEDGSDHPVLDEGQEQDFDVSENGPHLLVSDLGQGRVHHKDQPDGNGDVRSPHLKVVYCPSDCGKKISPHDPREHGQENPERQKPIKKGQTLYNEILFCHYLPPMKNATWRSLISSSHNKRVHNKVDTQPSNNRPCPFFKPVSRPLPGTVFENSFDRG